MGRESIQSSTTTVASRGRAGRDALESRFAGDGLPLLLDGATGTGMELLPEPSTCVLFGMGLLGLALSARRRRRVSA